MIRCTCHRRPAGTRHYTACPVRRAERLARIVTVVQPERKAA